MNSNNESVHRRKKGLWIYPLFQGFMLCVNVLIIGIVFSGVFLSTLQVNKKLMAQGVQSGLQEGHPYFQFLALQYESYCKHLLVAFVLTSVLTSLVTLFISFRLAGPILRLRNLSGLSGQLPGQLDDEKEKLIFREKDRFAKWMYGRKRK